MLRTRGRRRAGRNSGISAEFGVVEKSSGLNAAPASPVSTSALPEVTSGHSDTFLKVSSEEELLSGIWKEVEAKRIPPRAGYGMEALYYNYRDAVLKGGTNHGKEEIIQTMATVLDRILLQFEDPFTFPSYHRAIREPYDYYTFGQNYIRLLLDFRNSYVGNVGHFDKVEEQLKQGHNVVLFTNHQTEADPAVMSLLLETHHPYLAPNLTYIAGDRVVMDPFCKPFSMGRNLLCVYSKKHINDEPELIDMKRKANARSLKELAGLLRKGGQLIWIAPSGGRDRPDPITQKWSPAMFDPGSVENMRRLLGLSQMPGHMYPLALLCFDIMPPPPKVEKEIGEQRLVGSSGVGMSINSELIFEEITGFCKTPEEAAECFSNIVWERVNEQYTVMNRAIVDREGLAASTSSVVLSQPWTVSPSISSEEKIQPCHSI